MDSTSARPVTAMAVLSCGRIHNAHAFDLVLGASAIITLSGIEGVVKWSADNDEVLAIADDNGTTATFTATAPGLSTVLLIHNGRVVKDFHIGVYQEPTVTVGMKFTNVRDRTE